MPLASSEAIARASKLIGVPESKILALALTYAEANRDYSDAERKQAAEAVSNFQGGHHVALGHFERLLMLTWQSADNLNRDRLAIAFPAIADAWDVCDMEGMVGLRKWVAGTFGEEDTDG